EEEAKRKQAEERARAAAAKAAAPVAAAEATPSAAMAPTARPKMTPEEIEARKAEVAARRAGEPAPTPAPSIAAPVEQASSIAAPALSPNVTRPRMTPEEIEARKAEVAARRAGEPAPTPAPAPVAPTPMAARSDELELIEGIGPKIGAAFRAAGITTFKQLAATPLERMKEILAANSLRADPSTWAEQAALAAAGRLEELQKLQDQLIAGRRA
ncbi:MAG: hypothetical protein WBF31_23495, partial [Anaerolineae bacterium]